MKGLIIKIISNLYTVSCDGNIYECGARGVLRRLGVSPLVGDIVIFDKDDLIIKEILPRKNSIIRPPSANIDQAILITSVKEPDLSLNLLDKLLLIMSMNNIKPIICFTKLDLLDEMDALKLVINYYESLGYTCLTSDQTEKLKNCFKNKITVFVGQSGAGKSTLLNKLDSSLDLKTNFISKALGRGKHTTRHVELINMYGGSVLDTPGFSLIDLSVYSKEEIRDNFIEFSGHKCQYKDCFHDGESGCTVQSEDLIFKSRYHNYLAFLKEVKKNDFRFHTRNKGKKRR